MRALLLAFLGLFALTATPALAQTNANFTGVRAELNAGVDDVDGTLDRTDINYGAAVGLDIPLGDRVIVGVEGTAANVFDDQRILGVGARVGVAVDPNVLLYGRVGYENYRDALNRDLDGMAVGGGVEFALSRHAFIKAEYRYSDLSADVGRHGGLVGAGFRF